MTADQDHATLAAQRWYGTHQGQHLAHDCDRMVDRCADHLVGLLAISAAAARNAAMEALADLQADGCRGYVDVDRSNARMVVVRNAQTGASHMVTAVELFQLIDARTAASTPPAAPAG